ncbi:MAG: type II CAAX endopeptidase family protein [Terriglobales bacterium]|jgi:membrane protease YdiL (CAAX protease family)
MPELTDNPFPRTEVAHRTYATGRADEQPVFDGQNQESPVTKIFMGPGGLRAGWRFLIFVGLYFVVGIALAWLLLPRQVVPLWSSTARLEAVLFLSAIVASGVMGHFEKLSFADFGLPARGAFGAKFWEGTAWGFGGISILLLALHAMGSFDYGPTALTGRAIAKYALLWGGVFLLVGFAEEYTFRGYPQFTLSTGIGFWPSTLLLSALFGIVHLGNSGESAMGALLAGFIGVFFCLTLRKTGALWFAIGAHTGWDWGETFFYGVPDSGQVAHGHLFNSTFHGSKWITGGTVGPEGSVLALVVVALMIVLYHFRFGRVNLSPRR